MSDGWPADRLFVSAARLSEAITQLEPRLCHVITELSGLSLTPRQVLRLSGHWLLHLAHHVGGVIGSTTEEQAEREPVAKVALRITTDRAEGTSLIKIDKQYRLAVESLIAHAWRIRQMPDNLVLQKMQSPGQTQRRQSAVQSLYGLQRRFTGSRRQIWIVDPYLKLSRKEILTAMLKTRQSVFWASGSGQFRLEQVPINAETRILLASEQPITDFTSLVSSLIPLLIPLGYAEGLSVCREQLESMISRPPQILYTATGIQMSHFVQVAACFWGERGTRLCVHQHGGHSGLDYAHVLEDLEADVSDTFFTLGWSDSRASVQPLPTAMPGHRRRRPRHRLLMMSLESAPYLYRLQPFCLPEHYAACIAESSDFLADLVSHLPIVLRSEKSTFERLKSSCSSLGWEPMKGSGPKSAANAKLVVHNYFGTSWLETLAMNIPTVCFIPTGIHRFREAARPFVEALAKVGVIHHSGAEAAKFVNGLNGDPRAWWQSAGVQEAREAFVARYANFSDNWLPAWIEEFERLLAK